MRIRCCDRGEVDIIGPSEGLVASSILAGRTKAFALTSLAPALDIKPRFENRRDGKFA